MAKAAARIQEALSKPAYQVIDYYLKHANELAEYFESRAREEEKLLSSHPEWSPKGLRDRLLARRNAR
jgi:hypothetical protein